MSSLRASNSALTVRPFLAMEILERAQELERQGLDIVHLEVGEPDFPVPACVESALAAAAAEGHTHYTHSLGTFELREEISGYYRRRYGVEIDPARVVVTAGTSGAMVLVCAYLLDAGDEVLLSDPGYACYPNFVRAFHGEPVGVPLGPGFRLDHAAIEARLSARTRAVVLTSPSNPTGVIEDRDSMARLASLATRGVMLVSDEIYHALEYGDTRATSALEVTDAAFVVDGFSKRYAMTGLRLGWLVAPAAAVPTLQRLQQNLFICPSAPAQCAGLAALRHADGAVDAMRAEYAARREVMLAGLARLGLDVPGRPEGAYYVLADARRLCESRGGSLSLARAILEEAHVGVTPGVDFGAGAEGFLRFSFASSRERIEEGLRRLSLWLDGRSR